jgi:type IV pilus assembly protein PilY1
MNTITQLSMFQNTHCLVSRLLALAIVLLLTSAGMSRADDTDVYLNPGAGLPEGSEPMVMFSLDYRPNLGSTACNKNECAKLIAEGYLPATGPYTYFDVLRAALRKVFDPLTGVRVGLMLNHENNNNCAGFGRTKCSNGGYIAMGFQSFDSSDSNGAKARFHSILDALPVPKGNVSHSYQGKELFFEFFRYLTGQGVYNGHNGWQDYDTNNQYNLDVDFPDAAWDSSIETGTEYYRRYVSPFESATACSKVFTVNTMFLVSNQDDDSDAAIESPIHSGGFGSPQRDFPDVIRYLHDADLANGNYGSAGNLVARQNVTSYFLVDPGKINTTTTGYARAGGTGAPLALSENPDELVATIEEIFKQILSVSTTFVAASIPVNVFNRAEVADNVYIALFQVDKDRKPYWVGNVKKLRLEGANDSGAAARLVDVSGNNAIAGDGRIRFDALTYWTVPGSLPPPDASAGEVSGADGRSVARGGAGQKIPGFLSASPQSANGLGGRRMFYDKSATTLANFDAEPVVAIDLQADFGVVSHAEAEDLIAFARGLDIDDLDGDGVENEARKWIFGDPLHSRPLPLNYGARAGHTADNPAIYIAVASNDGVLHLIKNTSGSSESGAEVWAFMPRSSMAAQKTLRANATGVAHPYTLDGSPVAYIEDSNQNGTIESGEKVYLYIGQRRGGKSYYALDISDPENPQLMWRISKGGDFAELGYTFSNPRIGLVNTGSGPRPVLLFAGGYDFNKDRRGSVGSDDSEGNAIYVVDAKTGALIWKARGGNGAARQKVFEHPQLVDSIPSTLTVADTDGDGLTDRIVVGDTGGNIWRADIHGSNTKEWSLSLLASVGRHATAGKSNDRRFFHRPDLVQSKDADGNFDAVLIGSGDRPDPLDIGGTVSNYFYMIKDRQIMPGRGTATGFVHSDFGDVTDNCLQEGTACNVDLSTGWRLALESPGEKSLATPLTIDNTVYFTTYLPKGGDVGSSCAPSEGAGRLYAVSLKDATSVNNYDTSDDDPDSPDESNSKRDRYTELKSAGIPAEVVSIPPNKILRPDLQIDNINTSSRWRTFWSLQEDVDNPN